MDSSYASACGILFCYNEDQIIKDTLKFYLSQGIDLVIFDNDSTDSTTDIIKDFQGEQQQFSGRIQDVVCLKTQGYEWRKILRTTCDYMHEKLNRYEWILVIDADSFYCSPVKGLSLLEFMGAVKKLGYNILDGKIYEFYPTEKDDAQIASPIERMKYCKVMDKGIYFTLKYHKIFLYHPTVDFHTASGHICRRHKPKVCERIKFIYKHYPWTSYEHGLKKIFRDRKPRYVERKDSTTLHWHWMGMLPIKKDLVKNSREMLYYDENKILMPRPRFLLLMRFGFLRFFWNMFGSLKHLWGAFGFLGYMANSFTFGSKRNTMRLVIREIKKVICNLMRPKKVSADKKSGGFISDLKLTILSYKSIIQQEPCAFGFPGIYHFLMSNYCNAQCIFCNQISDCQPKELTLDNFKTMIEHIPTHSAKAFYFSGGGEPLLCRDLFPIIKFVNVTFPWIDVHIRTNGLLIQKFADELAQLNINRLEISVHGQEETNDNILQRKATEGIFKGIALLNERLKYHNRKMYKVFYPCVSRINITELPWLIRKASQLQVNEVSVNFCRYFPEAVNKPGEKLKTEDSLFFHKQLYNDTIKKAKKVARQSGVYFEYEPLFFKKFKEKPCLLPWLIVVVDWDGEVYPCNGGEVWLNAKVKSGEYHFGNLLREHLYEFWNNDSYVMIRRTCSYRYKEDFIPECKNCHNTLCFKGPDEKSRHILQPHVS